MFVRIRSCPGRHRTCSRLTAITSLLFLFCLQPNALPASAAAQKSTKPSAATLRAWQARLASADTLLFRHALTRWQPMELSSGIPCMSIASDSEMVDTLETAAMARVARALLVELKRPGTGADGPKHCTGDSLVEHDLQFKATGPAGTVFAQYVVRGDQLVLWDATSPPWIVSLNEHRAEFLAELHGALPDDSWLSMIPHCPGEDAAAALAELGPPTGAMVEVSEWPVLLKSIPAEYPDLALKTGVEGTVVVMALVGRDGRVRRTFVARSHPVFDLAALKSVEERIFRPGMFRARPVECWIACPVNFKLQD